MLKLLGHAMGRIRSSLKRFLVPGPPNVFLKTEKYKTWHLPVPDALPGWPKCLTGEASRESELPEGYREKRQAGGVKRVCILCEGTCFSIGGKTEKAKTSSYSLIRSPSISQALIPGCQLWWELYIQRACPLQEEIKY